MRPLRREIQMIFQDPYGSLNPRRRVGSIIGDAFVIHGIDDSAGRKRRVQELMELVGLNPEHYNRFPADFSGGQRQRIGVARALALRPKLIVCDEPVSALDVSIQAQVLNLLTDLQKELHLTYLFISHDLSVVRHVSDRIAVMYLGKIVETAPTEMLFEQPRHPYTRALLSALPPADPDSADSRERIVLVGDLPSPVNPPSGCRFHPRCPKAQRDCVDVDPPVAAGAGRQRGPPDRLLPPGADRRGPRACATYDRGHRVLRGRHERGRRVDMTTTRTEPATAAPAPPAASRAGAPGSSPGSGCDETGWRWSPSGSSWSSS